MGRVIDSIRRRLKRLNDRFRLVILDEDTLEETASFILSRKSMYIVLSSLVMVVFLLVYGAFALTPLKYYIPGYGDVKLRQEYIRLNIKMDSLQNVLQAKEKYWDDIRKVLQGDAQIQQPDSVSAEE
ncbi:MAG: hypothetical protein IMW88_02070 [Thermoflavifilum sp.]|jgi:hypothetical protein|uniref:hypothetical protein n=1 Tax=Thermoflavifilum sp. TaxID=1968839 RepID=UPI0018A62398|nr:hypothetical protein [Thermoflavifilum sp.]QOR76368.1 MAG: hypothetical protein IMW88_02070 [Thermoflavifilum sp.]